jgi:two-component system nitrate/nitrite sensor histidine kinase NarX
MPLRALKWFTILLPPLIIGSFEYIRHGEWMLRHVSMERGNLYITLLSLAVSYAVSTWLFRNIEETSRRLAEERAKRAVLEERERLAREMHDGIAQMLFYLNVSLKDGKVGEARSVAAEIDGHLRQAIYNLRQVPDQMPSFAERVAGWIDEWRLMTGIETDVNIELPADCFSEKEQIALVGIIQEAFTNIRKHAEASRAAFTLRADDRAWEMRVRDNGKGFSREIGMAGGGRGEMSSETEAGIDSGRNGNTASGNTGIGNATPGNAVTGNAETGHAASDNAETGARDGSWPGKGKYGISIMKKRAAELGAEMTIDAKPGAGWEIVLKGKRSVRQMVEERGR